MEEVRATVGAFEAFGGMTMAGTGFGTVPGCLMFAHGMDNYLTGWNQVWYGEEQTPLTAQVLESTGIMSHETAGFVNNMASVSGFTRGLACWLGSQAAGYIATATRTILREQKTEEAVTKGGGFSLDALSKAGQIMDRSGLTKAGRSLEKHAGRSGSRLPKPTGNPANKNLQAQYHLDNILTAPGSVIKNSYRGRFGDTIEVSAPNGQGAVYDIDGKFLFFKE